MFRTFMITIANVGYMCLSLVDDIAAVKAVIDKARPVFASLPGVSIGGR